LFVYGHSLGTASAAFLGGKENHRIKGIILEAGFTNARDAYRSINRGWRWPWRKLIRLEASEALANWRPQPEELIENVKCPVLLLHGTNDRQLPVTMSEALLQQAGTREPMKRLVVIEGGGHFIELEQEPAATEIRGFIERYR
jgi:uncharacterized protein